MHQPGANHTLRALVTQLNYSVHTLHTFLRICPPWRSFESLSQKLFLILSLCFPPSPSLLYQAHQQPQGSLWFSYATFSIFLVLGLCTCFSFPFPYYYYHYYYYCYYYYYFYYYYYYYYCFNTQVPFPGSSLEYNCDLGLEIAMVKGTILGKFKL